MQLSHLILLLVLNVVNGQRKIFGNFYNLPTAVRLGSAIVAAVEEDVEQEEQHLAEKRFTEELSPLEGLINLLNNTAEGVEVGRGKLHEKKKIMKYVYPLIMGILLAKTVIIPLSLKMLTAISTSSFVMSKIALAASALMALKWIIGGTGANEAKERLEIIHLPVIKGLPTDNAAWSDSTWSASNFYDINRKKKYRHNYIPLDESHDLSLKSTTSTYRYPQHNYNTYPYDGKPFL